jgi:ABC-type multidrug transport system ATPase subunit
MIQTRGLTRRFGDVTVVDDVSFDVPRGQLTGFVGGNGAGKTTTMRMVMGLLGLHGGEVRWDDRSRLPTGDASATCPRSVVSTRSRRSSTSWSTSASCPA